MNSFELNKIAMGVLMAMLLIIGLGNFSELVFHEDPMEANAYPIEVASVASADVADVAADEGPAIEELLLTASADKGANVFKKCAACHTTENGGANKIGPNLWNVVGKDIGTAAGFGYSDAMTSFEGNWSFDYLNKYLTKPKDFVPGNKMVFAGLKKASDRAAVIMYLRSFADTPMEINVPVAEVEEAVEEAVEAVEEAASEAM